MKIEKPLRHIVAFYSVNNLYAGWTQKALKRVQIAPYLELLVLAGLLSAINLAIQKHRSFQREKSY